MSEQETRCWLWSAETPEGQIFNTAEEVEEALENGWVDSPDLVEPAVDTTGPIQEVGGGWFEVTHDGETEKVQGRGAAEALLSEMQAAATE